MPRKEEESHTPEQKRIWLLKMQQQFRQAYQMGKIFYELRKSEDRGQFDYETGKVLFDDIAMPEDLPTAFTSLIDPEKGQAEHEAWDNRTKEIISSTKTWLRIRDDGAVEITHEHTRYDQGYITPTIEIDDIPDALAALTAISQEEAETTESDPIRTFADQVSQSSHTLLKRSEERFVLRSNGRGGSVEMSSWVQEYDYDGNTTRDEMTAPVVYELGNEKADHHLMSLRFNMLSELRYTLNKAVESEAPDHYAALFTPVVRQQILQMALSEIQIAAEHGVKKTERDDTEVDGHSEFSRHFILPTADYSRSKTSTDENGVITIEQTHLSHDLDLAIMAGQIEVPPLTPLSAGFGYLMKSTDLARRAVDQWEKSRKLAIGEAAFSAEISAEIERLKIALVNNEDSIHGQIRILTIDPKTSKYTYQFAQRIPEGVLNNHTDHTILESRTENLQNPGCDELATLLTLAI